MDLRGEAAKLGEEHATNAASWVIDGNTGEDHVRFLLEMIEAGDPAVDDYLPAAPNLSGEWADSMTPRRLMEELGFDPDSTRDHYTEAAADAYEEAVAETFQAACEANLRRYLAA